MLTTAKVVHAGMLGLLVTAFLLALGGCSGESGTAERPRRDADAREERQRGRPEATDTSSLVSPVRGDSLIGAARGAGGVATLRGECASCHVAYHGVDLGTGDVASTPCIACHERSHETVQAFYAGAVRGVAVAADTMFVQRVSCTGCHTSETFERPPGTSRLAAYDAMCASCHGKRFAGMVVRWRNGMEWRLHVVDGYVARAASDPRLAGEAPRVRTRAAREALTLVRTAGALHNVRGADQLFRAAVDSVAAAYARAGVAAPARPPLGPGPASNACMSCHYGVETTRATVYGETFDHASHVVRGGVECKECHTDATFFRDARTTAPDEHRELDPRHGKTTLTQASCSSCHHDRQPRLACATCHTGDERLGRPIRIVMALALKPANAPTSRPVAFQHAQHEQTECASCHKTPGSVRNVATCSSCHTDHHKERAAGCASCHGSNSLADHKMDAHFKCANCHVRETVARLLPDRAFCVSCHVKQVDHEPKRECAPCHLQVSPTEVRRRIMAAQPPKPPQK